MEEKIVSIESGTYSDYENFIDKNLTEKTKRMILECIFVDIRRIPLWVCVSKQPDGKYIREGKNLHGKFKEIVRDLSSLQFATYNTLGKECLENFVITIVNDN